MKRGKRLPFVLWVLFLVMLMLFGLYCARAGALRHREAARCLRAAKEAVFCVF